MSPARRPTTSALTSERALPNSISSRAPSAPLHTTFVRIAAQSPESNVRALSITRRPWRNRRASATSQCAHRRKRDVRPLRHVLDRRPCVWHKGASKRLEPRGSRSWQAFLRLNRIVSPQVGGKTGRRRCDLRPLARRRAIGPIDQHRPSRPQPARPLQRLD